jgi:hypothetical protein
MFYDVFSQNGQRLFLIPMIRAKSQLAFTSAHFSIVHGVLPAFLFIVSLRVGLPPLLALRLRHSWFPTLNPIATRASP